MTKAAKRNELAFSGQVPHTVALRTCRTVTLIRVGHFLLISPCLPALKSVLYSVVHSVRPNAGTVGYMPVRLPAPLLLIRKDTEGRQYYQCYMGLAPLIEEWLRRNGYSVRWKNKYPTPLAPIATEVYERFAAVNRRLLSTIDGHRQALFQWGSEPNLAELIAQIAVAWPEERILVWVLRRADSWRLFAQLKRYLEDVTLYNDHSSPEIAGQVVVSTYSQTAKGPIEIESRGIVIVADALHVLTARDGREALRCSHRARLFGFVDADRHFSALERDRLLALYGPCQITLNEHGREPVRPTVVFVSIGGGPPVALDATVVDLKRQGIWQHPVRNRRIVLLAQALADRNKSLLGREFPSVLMSLARFSSKRIGILVENLDHALELQRMLGWKLISSSVEVTDTIVAASDSHFIATLPAWGDVDLPCILIRADGGVGLPAALRNGTRGIENNHLIIDFRDAYHPTLRKWSRQRREAYRAAGWLADQDGKQQHPLDQFLSTRPKVDL